MTGFTTMLLWASLGLGCTKKEKPRRNPEMSLVESLRDRSVPYALQARYQIHLESPQLSASTTGVMVMHRPEKIRIEIMSPLGTPLFYIASNGTAINAWNQQERTYYSGPDALSVIQTLAGGEISLVDMIDVLSGLLPLRDAPIISETVIDKDTVEIILEGPEGLLLEAIIDPRTELVQQLLLRKPGASEPLLQVDYTDHMKLGRSRLPEELTISVPSLGWSLELEIHTWDELGVIPDAFDLQSPPGATQKDLVETLKAMKPAAVQGLEEAGVTLPAGPE